MTSFPNVPSNCATTRHVALTQNDLNREIALATGESTSTIAAMGFSLVSLPLYLPDRHPDIRPRRMGGPRRKKRQHRAQITPLHANIVQMPLIDKGA